MMGIIGFIVFCGLILLFKGLADNMKSDDNGNGICLLLVLGFIVYVLFMIVFEGPRE